MDETPGFLVQATSNEDLLRQHAAYKAFSEAADQGLPAVEAYLAANPSFSSELAAQYMMVCAQRGEPSFLGAVTRANKDPINPDAKGYYSLFVSIGGADRHQCPLSAAIARHGQRYGSDAQITKLIDWLIDFYSPKLIDGAIGPFSWEGRPQERIWNIPCADGRRPIHVAVDLGNLELANALLKAGADPDGCKAHDSGNHSTVTLATGYNLPPMTPLAMAAKEKRHDLIQALCQAGSSPNTYYVHADRSARHESPATISAKNSDFRSLARCIFAGGFPNDTVFGAQGHSEKPAPAPSSADEMRVWATLCALRNRQICRLSAEKLNPSKSKGFGALLKSVFARQAGPEALIEERNLELMREARKALLNADATELARALRACAEHETKTGKGPDLDFGPHSFSFGAFLMALAPIEKSASHLATAFSNGHFWMHPGRSACLRAIAREAKNMPAESKIRARLMEGFTYCAPASQGFAMAHFCALFGAAELFEACKEGGAISQSDDLFRPIEPCLLALRLGDKNMAQTFASGSRYLDFKHHPAQKAFIHGGMDEAREMASLFGAQESFLLEKLNQAIERAGTPAESALEKNPAIARENDEGARSFLEAAKKARAGNAGP